VSLVKDETLPDAHADREVAKLLVGLDQLMSRIDGNSDEAPKGVNQLAARMEIDPPKKTTTRTKKAK
jgi:hypothetical protein